MPSETPTVPGAGTLTVLKPGMDTWIIDQGRPGFRDRGVSPGGPSDRFAHDLANALLGNSIDSATLEFTFVGPTLLWEGPPLVAVLTGAIDHGFLDDQTIGPERTFAWRPGQVLRTAGMSQGARAYLGVAGGLQSQEILGSRQTLTPLAAMTRIGVGGAKAPLRRLAQPLWQYLDHPFRILPGPESNEWDWGAFCQTEWTCGASTNRMGTRFEGKPLLRKGGGEMLSEPVLPGVIQINNAGLPMILGPQCQTIGGYSRLGCVIRADLDRVGQLRPGQKVTFRLVAPPEAEQAWNEKTAREGSWLSRLRCGWAD